MFLVRNLVFFIIISYVGGAYSTHGREANAYRVVLRRPERKRPFGRLAVDGRIRLIWNLNE
jgi:hypothetical protein